MAVLARTVFIESIGRYQNLFETTPPTICAQYAERVPMVKGRLDRKASTATGYAWLVWNKPVAGSTRLVLVPPRGGHFYECQNQRDTSNYMILVWL